MASGTGRAALCLRLTLQKRGNGIDNNYCIDNRPQTPPVSEELENDEYEGPGYIEYLPKKGNKSTKL